MGNQTGFRALLRQTCPDDKDVSVSPKQLEVRQSTNPNAGLGLFTKEMILKDTIFIECGDHTYAHNDTLDRKANDLAYGGISLNYDNDDNIEENTNIGYYLKGNKCYFIAIKDIAADTELSRHYGIQYWQQYEKDMYKEKLFTEYVYVDKVKHAIYYNREYELYGKNINEQYYYVLRQNNGEHINVTKNDFSKYHDDDKICDFGMKLDYLQKKYDEYRAHQEMMKDKYKEVAKDDTPPEYVYVDTVRPTIAHEKSTYLFAKKIDDKYYYLLSSSSYGVDQGGIGDFCKDLDITKCTDITKSCFSKYEWNDEICDNHTCKYWTWYRKDQRDKNLQFFWEKYAECNYRGDQITCLDQLSMIIRKNMFQLILTSFVATL